MNEPTSVTQARHRLHVMSWYRRALAKHPGGIVPLATAARMLAVSRQRIRAMAAEGHIDTINGMPGGTDADVFVAVDDLLAAPWLGDRGKRGKFANERNNFRKAKRPDSAANRSE